MQWALSYLFASRKINVKDKQHVTKLVGNYKLRKMVVSISLIDDRLHICMGDIQIPLLHKGAGKFVLTKRRFYEMVNVELAFRFDPNVSANILQVIGSGVNKHTFLKVP
jgi:hypothetical protein